MCLEALGSGKDDGWRSSFAQVLRTEPEDGDDLQKVVDVDGRGETRRTTRRHDVARAGGVVADGFGTELATEDAASMADLAKPRPRIAHRQAEVLARERVGHIDGFV